MKGADFREMGSCKKVLKVASLAFDKTFFPMDMLEVSCNITMFTLTVAAIDIYLRSAPTTEPSHIYALMNAVYILVGGIGIVYMTKWAFIKLAKFAESVELVLQDIRQKYKKLEQEQVKQDIQPELPPINEELLSKYLSAKFKGMGTNENYVPRLVEDLENLREMSPTEVQRFAVLLYESKIMVNKPKHFNKWVKIFFDILGMKCPKYISESRHEPTDNMIRRYYYIDMP